MNFVAQLEDYLRDLGAEARKKHPGVKEASERAILRLRTLQNAYASAVRKSASSGADHPTTSLFQSQDLLHPFLLAANYPNASPKLLDISFKAMRLLMDSNAVCPSDGIHMVRVWTIQAHVIMSQYQKINKSAIRKGTDIGNATNSTSMTAHAAGATHKSASLASTTANWLISGLIGTSATSASQNSSLSPDAAASSPGETPSKPIKNAVSSSSGQSGQYTGPSNKDMEKNALEILSCLLKLTELLKNEPQSTDFWTQSVSLCCLLLDFKKTVQQAAHSTLPQVLGVLYHTSEHKKYNLQTWEDLLNLASYNSNKKPPTFNGAFSLCRIDATPSKAPPPPSPELALELMATILKEKPDLLATSDKFLTKTMGVTVALLQQSTSKSFQLPKVLRVFQWTMVVIQTQSSAVSECRELLHHVIKPIQTATEACRASRELQDDFVFPGGSMEDSFQNAGNPPSMSISSRRLSIGDASNSQENAARMSLLPISQQWKAGLAVETVYHLLLNHSRQRNPTLLDSNYNATLSQLFDKQTILLLTEACSNFAVVGSSCQSHIMQLVDVCRRTSHDIGNSGKHRSNNEDGRNGNRADFLLRSMSREENTIQSPATDEPMLFHRAEQLIKSGTVPSLTGDKTSAGKAVADKKAAPSTPLQVVPLMGEAIWVAFHAVFEVVITVIPRYPNEAREIIEDATFHPSMIAFCHFLKRVPGSPDLTRMSLNACIHLANQCMPATTSEKEQKRKDVLTSLCKLSLPTWGSYDTSSQLQNHHVRSLICLLRIVHSHYDSILSEWNVVLSTFEELSVMPISSPHLSDQMYHAALAISVVYGRFAPFSTCFSDESLREFVGALAAVSSSATQKRKLVTTKDNSVLDRVLVSSDPAAPSDKSADENKETIGGKLVRAIYGGHNNTVDEQDLSDIPIAKRTKCSFYEAYRSDFVSRLEETTTSSLRPDHVAMLPFGLAMLADTAMANSFRDDVCIHIVAHHICNFASVAPAIASSVMDTLAMLLLSKISGDRNRISFDAPARIVFENPKQHQLLAVEPSQPQKQSVAPARVSQAELFSPICECIRTVKSAAVAEAATTILTSILENLGHDLKGDVWVVIINAVGSLSGDSTDRLFLDRTASEWSNCCLLGFRCLKLIVDDFLDCLPSQQHETARGSLLDCCSSYGRSRHDVNTSLTAIGLLWTIADQDAGSDFVDRALKKLVELASDSRPEVRNCSVNTLFSCIVGRGNGFAASQWKSCICDTVFGVYDLVLAKANDSGDSRVDLDGNSIETSKSRYKVNVHHSRDSAGKQWVTTQVLTLQGLSRVLRSFFSLLLDNIDDEAMKAVIASIPVSEEEGGDDDELGEYETDSEDETESEVEQDGIRDGTDKENEEKPWLQDAWGRILDFALEAASQEGGRDTVDLRYAGVDLLVLCGQLSCKAGIQAAITPARVGTNMQVINGALRDVNGSNSLKDNPKIAYRRSHSQVTESYRETLFLKAMDRIDSYREFIETLVPGKDDDAAGMEATQLQVLQKFVSGLVSLYECCKDDELSQKGELGDRLAIKKYFEEAPEMQQVDHLECRFVRILIAVAEVASGGPRFLSQAQRCSIDLLRSMIQQGSSEALFRAIKRAGPWLFCRREEGGGDKGNRVVYQNGTSLVGSGMATVSAEEISSGAISDSGKVLALWLVLCNFPSEILDTERKGEGRRKAYYKNFLCFLPEGLRSSRILQERLPERNGQSIERSLIADTWKLLCSSLSLMLSPIPDATSLQKISRVPEVLEIIKLSIEFAPASVCEELCTVLSQGASSALGVERANRNDLSTLSEGEMNRKRQKYRQDALTIFKTCYAGVCKKKADDPGLLNITDKAFADALTAVKSSNDKEPNEEVCVDTFLMICQAFEENPGMEGIIVSSFPLLCKLVQTNHEAVRNAAASALGSANLRQVLTDARVRYQDAEKRAEKAEKEVSSLSMAVADLQKKNEVLQQQVALSSLHLT